MDGSPPVAPGWLAGRYRIERELGRGATSVVYLAHDSATDRQVAVKLLRGELLNDVNSARFLREMRLTARLEHPSIVPLLDSGDADGLPFLVLAYMDGATLRARLRREKQLQIADAIAIGVEIAGALTFAHGLNTIHRDVKPENILFSDGRAWLGDFGIARAFIQSSGEPTTSTGIVRGTAAYMSPEQAAGDRDLDARSDVYSLGCVLYEAIAGVAPFVGPTAQSVAAQRLVHEPRDVRVYRPKAPPALAAALAKALAQAPPDRFQSAAAFESALRAIDFSVVTGETFPVRRRGSGLAVPIAISLVGVLAVMTAIRQQSLAPTTAPLDTTTLAVLPFDGDDSAVVSDGRELLQESLGRWRGIAVVDHYQVADGYRRRGTIRTGSDAADLARSLGAGRYVRGRVNRSARAAHAVLTLYDTRAARELNQVADDIPADEASARRTYQRMAAALLLRGGQSDSSRDLTTESTVLPALQEFARAQHELDEWNLAGADSALERAVGFDAEYARAGLWLAQVRSWRDLPTAQWVSIADRAVAMAGGLSERERMLGQALAALARSQYQSACATYEALRRRNDRDFAAWFGLGQCRAMDRIVVADSSSPSRWRFRSDYGEALAAYKRAFEILPSVHRGYERGAFERLRVLLLTSGTVRTGFGERDSARFYARPGVLRGAVVLVPYPWQMVFAGDPRTIPAGFLDAIRHQRGEFRQIAARWSAAFPQSAEAKFGVALSLEMLGDRAAIDTIRAARQLTSDRSKRLRFAVDEVMLLLKFGSPDRADELRAAARLSDSLLAASRGLSGADLEALAPTAALAGRCGDVDRAAHAAVPPLENFGFPPSMWLDERALVAKVALGCRSGSGTTDIRKLATVITREFGRGDPQTLLRIDQMLLSRPVLLADAPDSLILARVATTSSGQVLKAMAALSRHDIEGARTTLAGLASRSQPTANRTTPDVALPEARAWLRVGDTTTAIRRLDRTLSDAPNYDPEDFTTEPANVGAFVRAMALRAELAAATGDSAGARRWASAVSSLWSSADQDLQPLVKRMSRLAGAR